MYVYVTLETVGPCSYMYFVRILVRLSISECTTNIVLKFSSSYISVLHILGAGHTYSILPIHQCITYHQFPTFTTIISHFTHLIITLISKERKKFSNGNETNFLAGDFVVELLPEL